MNELDDDGWRRPKRQRPRQVYDLAKAGMPPMAIAEATGYSNGSVRVMLHYMSHPRPSRHGWSWKDEPKTRQKRYVGRRSPRKRVTYERHHTHHRVTRVTRTAPAAPMARRGRSYAGWRYAGKSRMFHQLD
jgi:hypothetical protein